MRVPIAGDQTSQEEMDGQEVAGLPEPELAHPCIANRYQPTRCSESMLGEGTGREVGTAVGTGLKQVVSAS